jgi:hypothetical protein
MPTGGGWWKQATSRILHGTALVGFRYGYEGLCARIARRALGLAVMAIDMDRGIPLVRCYSSLVARRLPASVGQARHYRQSAYKSYAHPGGTYLWLMKLGSPSHLLNNK